MAVIPEEYLETLQFASDTLKGLLAADDPEDRNIVEKGLLLYRQGLVSSAKFEGDYFHATIQDVTPAKVVLDLSIIQLSKCSCPNDAFCRHQLAAFFYLLAQSGSVATWVEQWRQPMKEKKAINSWGIQRAKDLLKSTGQMKPKYETWVDSFNESFEKIMFGNGEPKPYLISDLFHVYSRRLRAGAPLEQEWKLLYLLIGDVYAFKNLLQLSYELEHDEELINRYYRHLFHDVMENIAETINKLSVHSLPFAFDQFIEKLKDISIDLLLIDLEVEFERIQLYRILWTHLFKKKDWREEEKHMLKDQTPKSFALVIGWLHMHILLRHDDTAHKMLVSLEEDVTPYMMYWIDLFSSGRDWKRVEPFVVEFIQKLKDYLQQNEDYNQCLDFTNMALKSISPYIKETNRYDLFEKALIQTLPYSYREYEFYLFNHNDYVKWIELQSYIGFSLSMLPKDRLKVLEKEEPALLLPLYHQSIQAHIDIKNRDHYRQAVKEMKKLRTLYKKLKRLEDWNHFLNLLLDRTKRLRAFHEECQRGKLIHVEN